MLRDNAIALDVCPISNLKLRVVPSASEHPIKKLLDAGVVCTVSTDDPISFGNTIEDEYEFLARELQLSESELERIAQNGFEIALKRS
jgi:adenosine deaminase